MPRVLSRRVFVWVAVSAMVTEVGCAARPVPVAADLSGGPSATASAADRRFCDEAAVAQADGIAGRDAGVGAAEGVGFALHPVMVAGSMGLSLIVAPVAALPGAIAAGVEDRKLRHQAHTRAMSACLALVDRERELGRDDPEVTEGRRSLARSYVALADTSAASGAANAAFARNFARQGGPADPSDRIARPEAEYQARAHRDWRAAEALYRRALAVQEGTRGPDHLDEAETLERYAAMLRTLTRPAEAADLEARARGLRAQ